LSKLLSFLINPLVWIIFCLLLARFLKKERWKKRSLTIGILLLLFFSNEYISNLAMYVWEERTITVQDIQQDIQEPYDIGILLGGYSKITKQILDDNHLFLLNSSASRLTQTIELYKLGKIKKLLLSGSSGDIFQKGVAEAENAKRYLIKLGVPETDIIIESKSRNTYENALFTKEALQKEILEKDAQLLLITSAFHIYRAEKCFKKVGLNTTPFSVDFHAPQPLVFQLSDLVPSPLAIQNWQLLIKEWVGLVVYRMKGYL